MAELWNFACVPAIENCPTLRTILYSSDAVSSLVLWSGSFRRYTSVGSCWWMQVHNFGKQIWPQSKISSRSLFLYFAFRQDFCVIPVAFIVGCRSHRKSVNHGSSVLEHEASRAAGLSGSARRYRQRGSALAAERHIRLCRCLLWKLAQIQRRFVNILLTCK